MSPVTFPGVPRPWSLKEPATGQVRGGGGGPAQQSAQSVASRRPVASSLVDGRHVPGRRQAPRIS